METIGIIGGVGIMEKRKWKHMVVSLNKGTPI